MAVTPTGSPAWVHANDHTSYGGNVNKQNYAAQDVTNPITDVSAQNYARLAADLEAVQRVAGFARITYTCNDTVAAVPTIGDYNPMVGNDPASVRNGDGDVSFTWLTTYSDPYGIAGAVNITHAEATLHGGSGGAVPVEIVSATEVRVRAFTLTGTPIADAKVTLEVTTSAA